MNTNVHFNALSLEKNIHHSFAATSTPALLYQNTQQTSLTLKSSLLR